MREECKHFQSRTYDSGEVARFCVLGQAPDQPFSCPTHCITFEKRLADVGWARGTLVNPPTLVPEGSPRDREDVLAAASEIVNAVAPELVEERREFLAREARRASRGWRFWRR
ncbi:MAG: hypothetical protein KJS64_07160 [Acidobacteria bacterium]|nr:hypothetical protein [Acidobacteriota bacterium]